MKTFEERYTAWVDGMLGGAELETFERELKDRAVADDDRTEARKLGNLLRSAGAPGLTNADFFSHQLLARIESDRRLTEPAPRRSLFSLPWLRVMMAGAAALVIGWMLGSTMNPGSREMADVKDATLPAIAGIISAEAFEPEIFATIVEDEQDNMTVVWLDGLDYLPASYELQ